MAHLVANKGVRAHTSFNIIVYKKSQIILCCVIKPKKSVNSIVRDGIFLMDNNCYVSVTCHMSNVQMAVTGVTFQCKRVSKFIYMSWIICSLNTLFHFFGFTHSLEVSSPHRDRTVTFVSWVLF